MIRQNPGELRDLQQIQQSCPRITRRRLLPAFLGLVLAALCLPGCTRTPQIIDDEGVYHELDALYTAVAAKRSDLLQESQARLAKLSSEGRLSAAGRKETDAVCTMAAEGKWRPAVERLYKLMRNQRRSTESRHG